MKFIIKLILCALGLGVGLFALILGVLAGGGVHIKYYWSSYFFFSMLLPFLTPYAFIRLLSYREEPIKTILGLMKAAIIMDLIFIASMYIESTHLPVFYDLLLMVVLWFVWQVALLLAYFLKLISRKD